MSGDKLSGNHAAAPILSTKPPERKRATHSKLFPFSPDSRQADKTDKTTLSYVPCERELPKLVKSRLSALDRVFLLRRTLVSREDWVKTTFHLKAVASFVFLASCWRPWTPGPARVGKSGIRKRSRSSDSSGVSCSFPSRLVCIYFIFVSLSSTIVIILVQTFIFSFYQFSDPWRTTAFLYSLL